MVNLSSDYCGRDKQRRFNFRKFFLFILLCGLQLFFVKPSCAQVFPNPANLSTGQGLPNTIDPIWLASDWYTTYPPNPMGLNYIPTLINNNCAPGAWVDPASLPPPINNGNWITGSDGNCATNETSGYRYFRLTLNLPPDCNGYSVTVAGNYVLDLQGYVDNIISDVFINGNSTGITGGSFSAGTQLNIQLVGPWVAGTNYVDILVLNYPQAPGINPYGLLMVANATTSAGSDTDNDGVSNLLDQCPCEPGNNPVGCLDPVTSGCDLQAIRNAFAAAGCVELFGCTNTCSMYFLNPNSLSGSQAQAFAQNLGANLISVQSAAENQCVIDKINDLGYTGVIWIGFNDEVTEGTFEWYDQSPVTYTNWAPGEPNQSGNEDCVQIYPNGGSPGTWNDLDCNSANAKSIIEVNLCPIADAGTNATICLGDVANLMAGNTILGSAPYTYTWSNGTIGQSNPVSPATATNYNLVVTDRYSCEAEDSATVNVNSLPTVNAGLDSAICIGEPITLTASGAVAYSWDQSVTNGTAFNPTTTTTYTVSGTDANGCVNTDQVVITIHPLPLVNAGPDQSICINDTTVLAGSGAASYVWDNSILNGIAFIPATTITYTVTGTDSNTCVNTDEVIVTVNPLPVISFSASNLQGCIPMNITYTSSGTHASCEWLFGDGITSMGCGSITHSYTSSGCFTVTMIATSIEGCINEQTANNIICIPPNPIAEFTSSEENEPLNMIDASIELFNSSSNAINYLWNFGNGATSTTTSPSHIYPNDFPGEFIISLVAYNENGCTDTAYSTIVIEESLLYYVPNAFTPDGNQYNQTFKPVFTSGFDPFDYSFYVFNRWGEMIFESHDAEIGWDGTYTSQQGVSPDGIYTWKIEFKSKKTSERKVIIGNVTLIK